MNKIGFIGCGNMAKAIILGLLKENPQNDKRIIASVKHESSKSELQKLYTFPITLSNREVVNEADVIILAVKPQFFQEVIEEIKEIVTEKQVVISMAPGKSFDTMEQLFGKRIPLVRTMPNTPALVGEGMTGICANDLVTEEQLEQIKAIFQACGKVEEVPERLMNAVGIVSGSSPAFIFMLIEAMADAAVKEGMPRKQAYQFAAQSVLGSAKMVLETGMHPGELKDMVCSPGGSTIEGVSVLEKTGFRSSIIEAMKATADRSRLL